MTKRTPKNKPAAAGSIATAPNVPAAARAARPAPVFRVQVAGAEFGRADVLSGTAGEIVAELRRREHNGEMDSKNEFMERLSNRCRLYSSAQIRSDRGVAAFVSDLIADKYLVVLAVDGTQTAEGIAYDALTRAVASGVPQSQVAFMQALAEPLSGLVPVGYGTPGGDDVPDVGMRFDRNDAVGCGTPPLGEAHPRVSGGDATAPSTVH